MPQSRAPRLPRRLLLAAAAGWLAPGVLRAQAAPPSRDTLVKAAFLHKFASFVEFPPGAFARPDSPLRIGILGDDLVYRDLGELARDRDRDGHPVVVTRLAAGDALTGFHILYLKAGSPARITDLIATVPEGTLTVADSDGAHPRGSVLSFYLDEGRVRFGVSLEAAARQGLRLSPKLIAIARSMG
ncbi:YfiR family protein [Ramlibacter sp. XY19]|uniref:YfiR family protein n=1 Tax=Ramlibacter paludis TaxID=2908000 RepID=UPI0023DA934D|nr:YfiR family protein [Ramlibacter paludis]MCG2594494.1 YfiR family protein [Ramlibacter paludis]